MNTKNINLILILIIISLVIFPTLFYVKKEHNANLWKVVNKRVVEAADRCKNRIFNRKRIFRYSSKSYNKRDYF